MRMVIQFLTLAIILGGPALQAKTMEFGAIAKYCQHGESSDKQNSELARLLDQAQHKYATLEARSRDRVGLINTLDTIIRKSSFASILDCRDSILRGQTPFSYQLVFQDIEKGEQNMKLSYANFPLLSLEFNLHKPIAVVLFVYLHELTHVCQATDYIRVNQEAAKTENDNSSEAELARGRVHRSFILGEIEAFKNMAAAYSELIQYSKNLCRHPMDDFEHPFHNQYLSMEWMLKKGMFAQNIVNNYMDAKNLEEIYILDIHSNPKAYNPPAPKKGFLLRRMHPDLKKEIQKIGVPVIE